MDKIKDIIAPFFWGIYDSLKGYIIIFRLDKELKRREQQRRSPTHSNSPIRRRQSEPRDQTPVRTHKKEETSITKRILQCGLLNGIIFLCSIVFFESGFLPVMKFVLLLLFGKDSTSGHSVWYWIELLIRIIFQSIWVVPLFAVSKFINNLWFQDIGSSAYKYSRGRANTSLSLSKTVADFIFSSVVETLFLIQAIFFTYFPISYLGHSLYMIHLSLLYSLYAFEYKWGEMGWEIHQRLTCIETHVAYFIGYGLPLALLTQISNSWIINGCIFAIFFPFYIISANEANPGRESWPNLPIFSTVITISNVIFSVLGKEKKLATQRPLAQARR